MIQRIQSLYLFIGAVLMVIFCFTPFATEVESGTRHAMSEIPGLMILNIVIAALLLIAIFMFKNLKQQKTVALLSLVLIACSLTATIFLVYSHMQGAELYWGGGVLLLVFALICALMAYRGISKDHNLLKSFNRMR